MGDPVDLSERSIQNLTNAIVSATRGGYTGPTGSNNNTPTPTGGFNGSGMFNLFNSGMNSSITVLRGFTTGTFTASKALDTFGGLVSKLGPVGQLLGNFGTGVGQGFMDINNSLKTASQNGLYFGQNLGLYDRAILNSRMSLDEFNDMIRNNNKQLYGLGANVDYAGLTYLKMGKKLQDDPLTYNLIATGMGFDEFNKTLLHSASINKNLDLTKASNQEKVLDSAMGLALELDKVARLTGKNRQQMQKEMEQAATKTSLRLAYAAMTPEEKQGAELAVAKAKAYGDTASKAAEIYAKGGPMNKTETETVASISPRMQTLLQQLVKVQGSSPEAADRRRRLELEMDLEAERQAADKADIKSKIALAESGNKVAEGIATSTADMTDRGFAMQKERAEAEKAGFTDLLAWRKYQEEKLAKERVGKGPEATAAEAARAMNKADIYTKDLSKGAAILFDKFNTKLGESIPGIEGLNKVLRPFTGEQLEQAAKNLVNKANGSGRVDVSPTSGNVPSDMRDRIPKQQAGSKDVFGSWFGKDWGKGGLSILHGKEAVVPENKLGEFMQDMMPRLNTATSSLKGDLEKAKSAMPTSDSIEKMFSQIKMPDMNEFARNMPRQTANVAEAAMNDVAKGVEQLNMRIERLISAVTDGSDKSVRALKGKGNLLRP